MSKSRLWFPVVLAGLVVGLGNAWSSGKASTGHDVSARPPPHGDNGWGDRPGHPRPFLPRPELRVAPAEAARRTSFLALLDSPALGLLDGSEVGRKRYRDKATEALTNTFQQLPKSLEATYGAETGKQLWSGAKVVSTGCVYSGCYANVSYSSWRSFDAINQRVDKDKTLAWNRYPETRYRSGRTVTGDRFEVTWALVFPLRPLEDDEADLAKAKNPNNGVKK